MFHMPTPMLMGGGDAYARWLDYVNAIAAQDIANPNSDRADSGGVGFGLKRFIYPNAEDGVMYGSPVGSVGLGVFTSDSHFTRVAQHAFSTDALRLANRGRVVLLNVQEYGDVANFPSHARNGYTSQSYGGEWRAANSNRFEHFNPTTGRRVVTNPYTGATQEFDL